MRRTTIEDEKELAGVKVSNAFITRKLVEFTVTGSKTGFASFLIGTGAFPYLADHGFQGMVVLPGTFFIEMALSLHIEGLRESAGNIRNVEFLSPVILSDAELTVSVSAEPFGETGVRYTFREGSGTTGETSPCARLDIETVASSGKRQPTSDLNVASFKQQSSDRVDQEQYYRQLRANGNQYGPQFQSLRQVWVTTTEALARLGISQVTTGSEDHHLHPVLVDGVAQVLAAFLRQTGRTFILKGIGEIEVSDHDSFPAEMWAYARLHPQSDATSSDWSGDVEVMDDLSHRYLLLKNVRFTYLDRSENPKSGEKDETCIAISATFTAEPIEDSLRFWADYFDHPVCIKFAPYNQVFQELLDPASQLRQNREGFNVVLLNVGDWAAGAESANLQSIGTGKMGDFGGLARHRLSNGIEVAHLNRHETEYVYKEIFEDQVYLRHGIELANNATVIDIGANIGLFSLFVRSRAPGASVYSFEPSPIAFQALKANCTAYGPGLHPFNVGVSERSGSAQLTFYEKSSVFSSFHSDVAEDRQAIQAVVANMVRDELGSAAESVDEYVEELMTDRMNRQVFDCPLVSVSDIVRENKLTRIDLLKIDAEKCELEILRGIDGSTWPLIGQIVIEVHDRTRKMVDEVQEILSRHGFDCAVEEENFLTGSGLFNVYATRKGAAGPKTKIPDPDEKLVEMIKTKADEFVQALDAYTSVVGTPTILCFCPVETQHRHSVAFDQRLAEIEVSLVRRAVEFPQIHVIGSQLLLDRCASAEFHDAQADDQGHIPYTPEGFAVIGTSLFRTIVGLRRIPSKVIALDCDNTLWQGVCGEVGPTGVVVTPAHRAFQESILQQMAAGMLLCLCSKNNESDVWAVFEKNSGMVLKREHVIAARINWSAKSDNLISLAKELNLGVNSIVLIDDNPVECAEVRANCPEVTTLQLPDDPASIHSFLARAWPLDHLRVTDEDRTRTQKIRENSRREEYRGQVGSLKAFIAGLDLQVIFQEPARDQLSRVSQLTLRTNQFNFTTIRRSESEILQYLQRPGAGGLGITVRDRFGDYGLVGLLLFQAMGDRLVVDTFLLSCRVLGRGVEHRVLSELGQRALAAGKSWVQLNFRATEKNQPALDFIKTVASESNRSAETNEVIEFKADVIAGLRYEPTAAARDPLNETPRSHGKPLANGVARQNRWSTKFTEIASQLWSAKQIAAAIDTHRLRNAGFNDTAGGADLPTTLEGRLLGIWRKSIGNPRLGINDNFFDAGGTSLKAVQAVATIRRELQLNVSVVTIFECPTVRLLTEKLSPGKVSATMANEAMERGARRKQLGPRKRG